MAVRNDAWWRKTLRDPSFHPSASANNHATTEWQHSRRPHNLRRIAARVAACLHWAIHMEFVAVDPIHEADSDSSQHTPVELSLVSEERRGQPGLKHRTRLRGLRPRTSAPCRPTVARHPPWFWLTPALNLAELGLRPNSALLGRTWAAAVVESWDNLFQIGRNCLNIGQLSGDFCRIPVSFVPNSGEPWSANFGQDRANLFDVCPNQPKSGKSWAG